jgi:hypothetical protein
MDNPLESKGGRWFHGTLGPYFITQDLLDDWMLFSEFATNHIAQDIAKSFNDKSEGNQ